MARYRLSTDILSPIQSDISLDDASTFSFGSLAGTPDYDKDFQSPMSNVIEKNSDVNILCARTMENAKEIEAITNNIKKQTNINAEKKEKFMESCEGIKKSMDDLFYTKTSNSTSDAPSQLHNMKVENFNQVVDSRVNVAKSKDTQNLKVCKKATLLCSELNSQVSSMKLRKNTKDKDSKNSAIINREKRSCHQPNSSITSSSQTSKSLETKSTTFKKSSETDKLKEAGNLKEFCYKTERKMPVSNNFPDTEEKSLSIEKTIQIAIGMEMDNIRRFIMDQNLCIRKDLLKLQETAKQQAEVTKYLFSVTEELLEENKKLHSLCK